MNARKTILLDCDGPMASFSTGFLGIVEEITGFAFGPAVVTDWSITKSPFFLAVAKDAGMEPGALAAKCWSRVNRIGFCSSLPPIAGAKEAIREIRKFADVEVLTSPLASSQTWMSERVEWLGRHFDFAPDDVHFISKKYRVHGDVLLDDKPSHIREWRQAQNGPGSGRALLWDAPYNRTEDDADLIRVSTWDEVLAFARGFAE